MVCVGEVRPHLGEFGAEDGIGGGEHGRQVAIDRVEIEFVPIGVGDDVRERAAAPGIGGGHRGRGLPLARQGAREGRREIEPLGGERLAEAARLLAAECGERVVVGADARLSVTDEIRQTHRARSASAAATEARPRTRRSKSRKRGSRVWPSR